MEDFNLQVATVMGMVWVSIAPRAENLDPKRPTGSWYSPAELGDEHDLDERLVAEAVYRYLREWL